MVPGPTNVPHRVMQAMTTPIINHRSEDFRTLYKQVREKSQKVFQTDNDMLILTTSGTGGVEASVVNLVRKGDKVIIPVNGEFSSRLATMIENAGGEAIRLESSYDEVVGLDKVEEAFENNKDAKALYVVYNETSTGTRIPWLDKASEITSKYGAYYVVDAVSNLGGDDLPVDKWNVDICITATQKAIAAPPGLAMLSISRRAREFMENNPPNTLYLNIPRYFKYYENSTETPFTPALPLFFAYNEALNIILEEGLENRINRHKICSEAFYAALEAMGFTPFAKPEFRSRTVLAVNYKDNMEDKKFRGLLAKEFRVLVAGGFGELKGKVWRVGSMGEVHRYHVLRTLSAIAGAMKMLGMDIENDGIAVAEDKLKAL
ncbi:MAG: alanine--glyoxylate aminotransferase family protein [Candidatus Nitrosothermus koennekii]|nr:MAG: alanine--glyoxylate aminotransferase family protein [Candidatus Nitrosothermus koennekii]